MAVRNVEYIIGLRDNFSRKLSVIDKNLQATGKRIQAVGVKLSLAVTLPIAALGVAAVKLASDFEETESKFSVVFSSISSDAAKSAKVLRDNFGLSSLAAKQLLSDTGDLLTGFGFTQESALDLSTQVNKLAVDLASFTNFSGGAEGASAALTKALLGERESIKSLGISILDTDVKARVLLNTQRGLRFESVRQAKAVATLQLAQEQSKNAIGDFARTSQGFANQLRITQARLSDMAVAFGKILLPPALKVVKVFKTMIERFSALSPETKKTILIIGGLVAALGPLLVILGFLASTILPALITGFTLFTGPIGLVIVGITALIVLFATYDKRLRIVKRSQERLNDAFGKAAEQTEKQIVKLRDLVTLLNSKSKADFVQKRALDQLQRIFPTYFKNLDVEKAKLVDIEILQRKIAEGNRLRAILLERGRAQAEFTRLKEARTVTAGFGSKTAERREAFKETKLRQQRGLIANLTLQARKVQDNIARLDIQGRIEKVQKDIQAAAPGIKTQQKQIGITKITSAAPRIFNITIENLASPLNINSTTVQGGAVKMKQEITEALLGMLADVQIQAR